MYIFTGRFQPFHNGHLSVIEHLCNKYPNDTICIAIIKDFPFVGEKTEFDKRVDVEIAKMDSKLNAEITLSLINQVLHHLGYNNVVTTLMPRASIQSWGVIECLFDCDRTWVFTDNQHGNDPWEKVKSTFYESQGEKTLFVPINKSINGTMLRELTQQGNIAKYEKYLPSDVVKFYREHSHCLACDMIETVP